MAWRREGGNPSPEPVVKQLIDAYKRSQVYELKLLYDCDHSG